MNFPENTTGEIKVYICDHKVPDIAHRSRFFVTLVSGVESSNSGLYLGDLDGENIARSDGFSEMRHQHHVWQDPSRRADYVGFEHYRRAFLMDFIPSPLLQADHHRLERRRRFARNDRDSILTLTDTEFLRYLDDRAQDCENHDSVFCNWIENYDFILPRPLFDETIKQQWAWTHISHHWNVFVDSVNANPYFKNKENFVDFDLMRPSFFNMYIMKWSLFDEYMRFWTDCAVFLADRLPNEPRLLGHFSERLINIYVNQKLVETPSLRTLRLPIVYRET